MSYLDSFRIFSSCIALLLCVQPGVHAKELKLSPITNNTQILETELADGTQVMCYASDNVIMSGTFSGDRKSFISSVDLYQKEQADTELRRKKLKKQRRKLRRKIKKGDFKRKRKRKMRTKVKNIRAELEALSGHLEEMEKLMYAENEACSVRVLSPYSGRATSAAFYKKTITREEAKHLLRKLALNDITFLEDGASEYELEDLVNNILNPNRVTEDLKRTLEVFRDGVVPGMRAILPWQVDGEYQYVFKENQSFETITEQQRGLRDLSEIYPKGYHPTQQRLHYGAGFSGALYMMYGRYLSSIQAKMSHLWFGHFGTSWIKPENQNIREYFDLIYDNSIGNFREMILGTTDDACLSSSNGGGGMLCDVSSAIWLDHQLNTKDDRNQNFAREIMELYLLGPNDRFTGEPNYNELDVVASTAFTSGFQLASKRVPINVRFHGLLQGASEVTEYYLKYNPDRHDDLPWTAFQGTPYEFHGPATPVDFVTHIFDHHPGLPRFIADKLFRMIVHQEPNEELIDKLATVFKNSNFSISTLLYTIATSEAMFSSPAYERTCIKSPVEQYLELSRNLQIPFIPSVSLYQTNPTHNWGGVSNRFRGAHDLKGLYALLSQSGEKLLLYDDVFTYDYCGRDENSKGYDWLDSTRLLYRTKNMIELIGLSESYNHYMFNYYRVANLIAEYMKKNTEDLTPQDLIEFFEDLYDVNMADNEKRVLLRYLTQKMSSDGTLSQVTWDMNNKILIKEKIAGLAALFLDMSITNVK